MTAPCLPILLVSGPAGLRWALVALLGVGVALALWSLRRQPTPGAMGFLEHMEDLRRRVLVSTAFFFAGTTFAFGFRLEPWRGLARPVPALHDNLASQVYRRLVADLVPDRVQLVATGPLDGFMAEFSIAMGLGLVLSLPVLLWQLGGFFAPALRPRERRALALAFLPMLALFALGVAFGYRLVLPFLFQSLYAYAEDLGAAPLLRLQDFVAFSFGLLLVLGLAFQTPLAMGALSRAGVVAPAAWLRTWRHAVIVILVLSALVTDPTILSQLMVAVPLVVLYFIGVGLARLMAPRG